MIYTLTPNPALDLELTVAKIQMGQIHRATGERIDFGGKGFNVSRVLNVLGIPNVALGFIAGTAGTHLELGLRAGGITTDLTRIAGETRTNVSIVGSGPENYIKINQPGAAPGTEDIRRLLKKIASMTLPGDLWVLSGSLPPGAPEDFYQLVITRVRNAGGEAILDTSGAALGKACREGVRLLKPNAEEASQLTGQPVGTLQEAWKAAQTIQSWGARVVVLSLGEKGAVAVESDHAWLVKPPRIAMKNPVGAGDALVAGLAAGMSQNRAMVDTLRLGTACGASAAGHPGTGVGSKEEILALMGDVDVKPL